MQPHLPNFNKARVLVMGDVMLDRYWSGDTLRISPEAPVPVVHVRNIEERPGGAGNVALNIASLGSHVKLVSVCGADPAGDTLASKLQAAAIECHLLRLDNVPTVTKLRILSLHQQLIRLDFEEPIQTNNTAALLDTFKEQLKNIDVVVFSDYAKGNLRQVDKLIALARAADKPIFIDPKGQNFSIYRGATLLTPNRKEFEAVVGHCRDEAELERKGMELLAAYDINALLITRGEQGMSLIRKNEPPLHLPTHAREVYDVTGAGDTVIGVLAAAYAGSYDLAQAASLANLAAGIVVGKLGTATVSIPELRRALHEAHAVDRGIMTEEQLLIAISDARAHKERIVMTGGCFDILHAGHIAYLEEAKALGDRLIVAVNSDASVRHLKGPGRPINSLENRMNVLAGLYDVDWVVPFDDHTPEKLVSRILPDVWVKGGDYRPEDLPEARPVLANGGQVHILKFIDNCSTTGILNKIKNNAIS